MNGRRFSLGLDREAAFSCFYELMLHGDEEQADQKIFLFVEFWNGRSASAPLEPGVESVDRQTVKATTTGGFCCLSNSAARLPSYSREIGFLANDTS